MILYRKARLEVCIRGNDIELWWPGSLTKAITLHQHAEHCPEWEDGGIVTVSVSNTRRKASPADLREAESKAEFLEAKR